MQGLSCPVGLALYAFKKTKLKTQSQDQVFSITEVSRIPFCPPLLPPPFVIWPCLRLLSLNPRCYVAAVQEPICTRAAVILSPGHYAKACVCANFLSLPLLIPSSSIHHRVTGHVDPCCRDSQVTMAPARDTAGRVRLVRPVGALPGHL